MKQSIVSEFYITVNIEEAMGAKRRANNYKLAPGTGRVARP